MPRLLRTIVPRFRRSLAERGIFVTILRSTLLPFHLVREYVMARRLGREPEHSEFDRKFGVDTDGEFGGWTFLSDLNIPSPNWIEGHNYAGIEPERFFAIFEKLPVRFEDFVFIDFGSGKGRALLLASEYPFKKIIGIEFSPQLNAIAKRNIALYASGTQKCRRSKRCAWISRSTFCRRSRWCCFSSIPASRVIFEQVLANVRAVLAEKSAADLFDLCGADG